MTMPFTLAELDPYVEAGLVTARGGPGTLMILNYTPQCAYDRKWDRITTQCRGLIVDTEGWRLVARPFPKFFNYGEEDAPVVDPHAPCQAYDKVDGSLGILYRDPTDGTRRIATRGSFFSEQALHATRTWERLYEGNVRVWPDHTYLFEIVYPQNRIVVDYEGLDDLVLLAVLDNETGENLIDKAHWPGPRVESLPHFTLASALVAEPRPGQEGMVLEYGGPWPARIKLKQEDYVKLHRIVTGLTRRRVWEMVRDGEDVAALAAGVPDEFVSFIEVTLHDLKAAADGVERSARDVFEDILLGLAAQAGEDDFRKRFAELAKEAGFHRLPEGLCEASEVGLTPLLFALLDRREVRGMIWKTLRPPAEKPRWGDEEAT